MSLDEHGRPLPWSTWGGIGMPAPGTYRVKLHRHGLWVPALVRIEQGVDPDTRRLLDRWAPILRILQWWWFRWELMQWQGQLHPVSQRDFDLACARPLPGDPLEPFDAGESPLVL